MSSDITRWFSGYYLVYKQRCILESLDYAFHKKDILKTKVITNILIPNSQYYFIKKTKLVKVYFITDAWKYNKWHKVINIVIKIDKRVYMPKNVSRNVQWEFKYSFTYSCWNRVSTKLLCFNYYRLLFERLSTDI